jgi:hypothetical protein
MLKTFRKSRVWGAMTHGANYDIHKASGSSRSGSNHALGWMCVGGGWESGPPWDKPGHSNWWMQLLQWV